MGSPLETSKGAEWGGVPLTSRLGGLGSIVCFLSGVRGGAPAETVLVHFQLEKTVNPRRGYHHCPYHPLPGLECIMWKTHC